MRAQRLRIGQVRVTLTHTGYGCGAARQRRRTRSTALTRSDGSAVHRLVLAEVVRRIERGAHQAGCYRFLYLMDGMGAGASGGLAYVVKVREAALQSRDMKLGRLRQFGASFISVVRHIVRRPLLILVLVLICVGTRWLQNTLPQPWDGLPFGFGFLAAVWSIRSLPRSQEDQQADD